MTTRRKFTGALLAAGALANFTLVAGSHGEGSGNNGNPCNGHGKADECHGNGAKKDTGDEENGNPCNGHGKADECHGNGAKKDTGGEEDGCTSSARMSSDQTPPPACNAANGKNDHVE